MHVDFKRTANPKHEATRLFSSNVRKRLILVMGLVLGVAPPLLFPTMSFADDDADGAMPLHGTTETEQDQNQNQNGVATLSAPSTTETSGSSRPLRVNADQRAIDVLTRKILLAEIELERFNLDYQQNVAKQGRWKGLRYAAVGEANSSLGLSSGIVTMYNRGSNLRSPKQVNVKLQENANVLSMIGSIIGAGGAAMEFGINGWHEVEARRKGYGSKQARRKVEELKAEIDRLLAQRDALVAAEACVPGQEQCVEIDKIEGKILRDLRDQSLLEFQRFHINARKLLAFQQTQYLFDVARNVTGAIGSQQAYASLHLKDRRYNYNAGVLFVVSGALTMGGPIISRAVASGVGRAHKRSLRDTVADAEAGEVVALQQDKAELDRLCRGGNVPAEFTVGPVERSDIYGIHSKIFQDEVAAAEKARNNAKLIATQNIGSGLYVGCSKVASGVLFIVPGLKYNKNDLRSTTITNSDLFASAVVGLPASAYSILDTLRIQVKGEINRHRLATQGKLPSQLMAARRRQLDDMEKQLRSAL